ncbi:preprotein translocase subunit YajC [Cellulomonas sp. APG4]|uniref:preprotein translocase subunit YajC n=1 Tax=Cellulomonas sp. APG4 TaxID=1538656 RepID=UPI001379CF82|nr:preprotein translocase subunit YajC [Cellulomonas sp. APG4]NCT90896.1 preprotein translocase subunit YajC [Cellulomonas sp. APG4]
MDPILLVMLLGIVALFWMSSRTRKQQKEAAAFRENLAPGQEVMTGSGMFGTILAVDDEVITLETAPGVTSRWLRPAIAKLVEPPVDEDDEDVEDEDLEDDDVDDVEVPDDASGLTRPEDDERR